MIFDPYDYAEEVNKAARIVARSYGDRHDRDDIAQAIYLDMLENPTRYTSIGGQLFLDVLIRAGHRYCMVESARFLHYADQHTYSSEELKKILPGYYMPAVSDNEAVVVDLLDIAYALKRMTKAQRNILDKRYGRSERLASKYEQNLHGQAMKWLTYHVNSRVNERRQTPKDYEGPGSRKAMSNATALMRTGGGDGYDPDPVDYTAREIETYSRINSPMSNSDQYIVDSPWRDK